MFEDTKGVIRSRKSMHRQYNGYKKKDKQANNDLQNITHRNQRLSNTNPLITEVDLICPQKGKQFLLYYWHPSCCCKTTRTWSEMDIVFDYSTRKYK